MSTWKEFQFQTLVISLLYGMYTGKRKFAGDNIMDSEVSTKPAKYRHVSLEDYCVYGYLVVERLN